jgi:purine-cytosine permease-like protein
VTLLVVPAALVTAAGAGVWLRTGSTDVVSVLANAPGLAVYGNIFVTVGVFAPALTTTFSGALALRAVWPRLSTTTGMVIVATVGGTLATLRFDRALLTWLTVLAATLPPLIIPMATEAWRRRHHRPPRTVPVWTWLPAGLIATALTIAGTAAGPVIGLAVAALATGWHVRRAGSDRSRHPVRETRSDPAGSSPGAP